MPLASVSRSKPVDYYILQDAKPTGPSIGIYAGRDIPASVVDIHGRRFVYAGIAPRRPTGQYDTGALGAGEYILPPGLVYRLEPKASVTARDRVRLVANNDAPDRSARLLR